LSEKQADISGIKDRLTELENLIDEFDDWKTVYIPDKSPIRETTFANNVDEIHVHTVNIAGHST
jgi:hypothetical protein